MFDLTSKVAIITGGSRGIGRAIGEALAAHGAHVVLGYAQGEAAAQNAAAAIHASGGKAETLRLDVADATATEETILETAKRLGRLDIVVANAGVSVDGLLLRIPEEGFERMLAVNLKGAIATARAGVKVMMRARTGRIIFVSSVVGEMGNAGQTAYAATKAAVIGAMKSIAREYASRNITINAITPGFVETDMTAQLNEAQRAKISAEIPLGRIGNPKEVAAAAVFLASDEAGYVTGHALRVNGGMYM
jgi:3-oxoacyl-[acyl-carrier protein] reductase